jgi:hypothetical protein
MTDDLIRYNQTGYDRGMEPAKDGAWVFYAAAADRIDALEAEVAKLRAAKVPDGLIDALRSGRQADADGCMVIVSRQACEEAADLLSALTAPADPQPDAHNAAIRAAGINEALSAIAGLPTGKTEDVMEGQEQAYRAVSALLRPEGGE